MTGAAGFIGGHAYDHYVASGDEVLVVDKLSYAANRKEKFKDKNFVQMDISDKDLLLVINDFKPEVIVNFAAETHVDNSIKDSYDFIVSNVLGTANLLDACINFKIKICHISTDEVYGPACDRAYIEKDRLNPMNPYSATKAAADMMIKAYRNTHKIDYVIVRPSNNYGPNQNKEKFIPKLIDCISNGNKFSLYEKEDQKREWTFVSDTASITRKIILSEKKWNSTYNVSSGVMLNNLQVIEYVCNAYQRTTGKKIDPKSIIENVSNRPGHDKKYWISTKELNSLFRHNYINFQSGIQKTVASYVKK